MNKDPECTRARHHTITFSYMNYLESKSIVGSRVGSNERNPVGCVYIEKLERSLLLGMPWIARSRTIDNTSLRIIYGRTLCI